MFDVYKAFVGTEGGEGKAFPREEGLQGRRGGGVFGELGQRRRGLVMVCPFALHHTCSKCCA